MRLHLRLAASRAAALLLGWSTALLGGALACGSTATNSGVGEGSAGSAGSPATAGDAATAGTSALAGTSGGGGSSAGVANGGGGNASGGRAAGGAGGVGGSAGGTTSVGGEPGCDVANHAAQCWIDAVTPSLACLPDPHADPYAEGGLMGIVTADGSKCVYSDGTSVTFDPPLPPPDDWLDEAPIVSYRVERDGQVCFSLERTPQAEVTAGAPYKMKLTTPGALLESTSDGAVATVNCPDGSVLTLSEELPSCPQMKNDVDSLVSLTVKMDQEGHTIASGVTFGLFVYRDGEQLQTAKCAMGDVSY